MRARSIEFISPSVAVEQGTAKVILPEQEPEESEYTAIYVKHDDQWLLDRVTEEDVPAPAPSHYEQLKELEWMVGRWVDQDDQATVVTECNWAKNNNFLTRSFTIQIRDRIDMAGMQIIGWDPSTKLRSWVFDSDGGFGQGTWTKKNNRWYIQQSGVLPDGQKSSSVNIITYVDDNTCTLQSGSRTVDAAINLPLERKPSSATRNSNPGFDGSKFNSFLTWQWQFLLQQLAFRV